MTPTLSRTGPTAVLLVAMLAAFPAAAPASHSGGAHWQRSSNPFTVQLGDNVSATWDPHLLIAAADWSVSSVLDTVVVAGGGRPRTCPATAGRIEVCSASYGSTGWLALQQLWVGGGHITQATIKLNDTYLGSAPYNTSAFRQYILCHSIGKTLGLDDQEPPAGSCMGISEVNEHPNAHDYEELEAIYAHLDLLLALRSERRMPPAMSQIDFRTPAQWGRLVHVAENGRGAIYELDFGDGRKVVTLVLAARE